MSQASFAEEKDNSNNWLWMSWPTHQRFDGLNTIGKHRIPQIAIRFVSRAGSLESFDNGLLEREKVEIAIECPDADVFGVMRHRVKPGNSTVNEDHDLGVCGKCCGLPALLDIQVRRDSILLGETCARRGVE
jgi:hypothetical protein